MKKSKKFVSLLLTLCMLLSAIPVATFVANAEGSEFYAVLDGSKTLSFYYDTNKTTRSGTCYENLPKEATAANEWGYYKNSPGVSHVVIDKSVADYKELKSTAYMFSTMTHADSISGCEYLDVSNVTNMDHMFSLFGQLSSNIVSIPNVSDWNTGKVTNMALMFGSYAELNENFNAVPDVSKWDTSNVVYMTDMFNNYASVSLYIAEAPNVSNWNTSNVEDMCGMFGGYASYSEVLTAVPDVSNWDTSKVTDMSAMFSQYASCSTETLQPLDLSGWSIDSLKDSTEMFYCYAASNSANPIIYGANWNTIKKNGVSADDMFAESTLKGTTTGGWDSADTDETTGCFTKGYHITNDTKEENKATNGGYITVEEIAATNETVAVTVTPNDGYELDKIYVNGTAIEGTTFTMLASDVTVSATFKAAAHTHDGATFETELTKSFIKSLAPDTMSNCGYILPSGAYYLTDDLSLYTGTERLYIRDDSVVKICLNGHTLSGTILTANNADLTICSCEEGGKLYSDTAYQACVQSGTAVTNTLNFTGKTTIKNIELESPNGSAVEASKGSLVIENCTIKNSQSDVRPAISINSIDSAMIKDTVITDNKSGINIGNGNNITLDNVTLQNNTTYDVKVSANETAPTRTIVTLDGNTTADNIMLFKNTAIALGENFTTTEIGVTLGSNASAPYTICDEYSTCFKCTQLPYHIANKDGKSVLEYRIDEQPAQGNDYTFTLDKDGASTSKVLQDSDITYQWYYVSENKLSDYTADNIEIINFDDIYDDDNFVPEAGKCYAIVDTMDASSNSVTSQNYYDEYQVVGFAFKNDSSAPIAVTFTSNDDLSGYTDINGNPVSVANGEYTITLCETYGNCVYGVIFAETKEACSVENISFISSTSIAGETSNKISEVEDGESYFCIATLTEDGTEIKSDTFTVPVQSHTVTCSECSNGSVSVGDTTSYSNGDKVIVTVKPEAGFYVSKVYYQIGSGEKQEIELTEIGYAFEMPEGNVTVSAEFGEIPAEFTNAAYKSLITLKESIDLKMNIRNIPNIEADKLTITVDSEEVNFTYDKENGVASCTLKSFNPEEIYNEITIVVKYNGVDVRTISYSVSAYCNKAITVYGSSATDVNVKYVELCKALLNYGKYAEDYANKDNKDFVARTLSDDIKIDFTDLSISTLEGTNSSVTNAAASLSLGSTISLNFYVTGTVDKADVMIINNLNQYVPDESISVEESDKDGYDTKITVKGITAEQLARAYTLKIDGNPIISYGTYNYCSDAQEAFSGNVKLTTLCKAIYNYGNAAKAYSDAVSSANA